MGWRFFFRAVFPVAIDVGHFAAEYRSHIHLVQTFLLAIPNAGCLFGRFRMFLGDTLFLKLGFQLSRVL